MPKLMTRKDYIKKVGLFLVLTPLIAKVASAKTLFKGDTINLQDLTASEIVATNADKDLVTLPVATYPSLTELSYVKGVTSGVQGQLNSKLSGNQTITLSGNVTGSGATSITTTIANDAVATAKIADKAVTYAKIQDVTATRLLGRHSGTNGVAEEITLGTGLSFFGGSLNADQTGAGTATWGGISGTLSNQTDLNNELIASKKAVWTFNAQRIGDDGFLAAGFQQYVIIPYACTIKSWRIVSDVSGSVVVDIWKRAGTVPPDDTYSITGAEKPTLSSAQVASDTTLTTWTTSVSADDIIGWNIDSVSGINNFVITIEVEK